jgi:hypothetical protein
VWETLDPRVAGSNEKRPRSGFFPLQHCDESRWAAIDMDYMADEHFSRWIREDEDGKKWTIG